MERLKGHGVIRCTEVFGPNQGTDDHTHVQLHTHAHRPARHQLAAWLSLSLPCQTRARAQHRAGRLSECGKHKALERDRGLAKTTR